MTELTPRRWVPDLNELARQLVDDVDLGEGATDAVGTFASWEALAAEHGAQITIDDYQALAIRLAEMVAGGDVEPGP